MGNTPLSTPQLLLPLHRGNLGLGELLAVSSYRQSPCSNEKDPDDITQEIEIQDVLHAQSRFGSRTRNGRSMGAGDGGGNAHAETVPGRRSTDGQRPSSALQRVAGSAGEDE